MIRTPQVDTELRDDIAHLIEARAAKKDLSNGDCLVTLMQVAREMIRMRQMPPDARRMVLNMCMRHLAYLEEPKPSALHVPPELRQ